MYTLSAYKTSAVARGRRGTLAPFTRGQTRAQAARKRGRDKSKEKEGERIVGVSGALGSGGVVRRHARRVVTGRLQDEIDG